jgi:hypothetical protein
MADFGTPSITMTTHLWTIWADAAVTNLHRAWSARRALTAANAVPETTTTLADETRDSLVAVCAAAFALDSLIGAVQRVVMPQAIVAKWESGEGRRGKAIGRVREVLKLSTDSATADRLADQWEEILEARGEAAHFLERPGVPEWHPIGSNVSPEDAKYRVETAQAAVSLLLETLRALRDQPKSKLRQWATEQSGPIFILESALNGDSG